MGVEVRLHVFLTSAAGGWGKFHALAALQPENGPRYPPIAEEASWTQGPFLNVFEMTNIYCPTGRRTPDSPSRSSIAILGTART
jgi:hypothetical protein